MAVCSGLMTTNWSNCRSGRLCRQRCKKVRQGKDVCLEKEIFRIYGVRRDVMKEEGAPLQLGVATMVKGLGNMTGKG